MNLERLKSLFAEAGCTRLYAKPLAENDNSKNQIYFAGAIEALNVFPSREVFAENTKKGPSFKARLDFGWLLDNGLVAPAPHAQLILYSQYPEVRFSGFLLGCKNGPAHLMADRQRAKKLPPKLAKGLPGRILFLGVTRDRKVLGYVAPGNSEVAKEFNDSLFPEAFVVFREIKLPNSVGEEESRTMLLSELRRIHNLGWINSKQLDSSGLVEPCIASQCGGYTLEAELGIPKNSDAEPDFQGWEVKQHDVGNIYGSSLGGPITLMTPEPTGGFYKVHGVEAFVRKFGYPDKKGKPDRLNFGGVHRAGERHDLTGLTLSIRGYDVASRKIADANGEVALLNDSEQVVASWAFSGLLQHWSRKHTRAVYVPSMCRKEPARQYAYGANVRLAIGTDSLRLLSAFAAGEVYYDPGIKLENVSGDARAKRRSQFRVASKNLGALYEKIVPVSV